ncbi:class I SAM-dependent methyltransferase [Flavobacterium quisquiliarum]|uniref:S-adenosyl-L-methionine-dependent methyltransferase n=1 Tax=Flavobacterium quisquiliarum TaxID=1834436 RepID=A0ABV8W8K6_9FLAO|nr:class I SAM-dependent methyltransferase [Flavobacterium quisquiliarum]MBW1656959.1 SAM-dependent methyltransferase [Flavobacterium quisquiliarum]NWK99624.1 SAM-dependent methyltransferase [Flavobacterium collinsii]
MKAEKTSRTAQYMAFFRALETQQKNSLFSDPYAIHFIDSKLRLATRLYHYPIVAKYINNTINKKIPGAFSSGIARTKYIDSLLENAISKGVKQVIILGAGFDTRAVRLDFLKPIPVIEIDHPNTSNFKAAIYKKRIGKIPQNVTFLQIDFNKQGLDQLASEHNLDFSKPTAVIWEGVTNYLTEEAVKSTFSFISKFASGSHIIFTYVHKDILQNPDSFLGGKKLLKDLENIEEHWTFGFFPEELPGYLHQFHIELLEDLGANEYRERFLAKRSESGYEFYRTAAGIKK